MRELCTHVLGRQGVTYVTPIAVIVATMACLTGSGCLWLAVLGLYNLPPRFDERLALLATSLMPWACFLHLLFAVWMYGNNDILRSDVFSTSLIGLGENSESACVTDVVHARGRLARSAAQRLTCAHPAVGVATGMTNGRRRWRCGTHWVLSRASCVPTCCR